MPDFSGGLPSGLNSSTSSSSGGSASLPLLYRLLELVGGLELMCDEVLTPLCMGAVGKSKNALAVLLHKASSAQQRSIAILKSGQRLATADTGSIFLCDSCCWWPRA
jgi:hypothetical protein